MSVEILEIPKNLAQSKFIEHVRNLHAKKTTTLALPNHFLRIARTDRNYVSREYFGISPEKNYLSPDDFKLQASIVLIPSFKNPDALEIDNITIVDENDDIFEIAIADGRIVNIWKARGGKPTLLKTKLKIKQIPIIGWLVDPSLADNPTIPVTFLDYSWRFIDPYQLIDD